MLTTMLLSVALCGSPSAGSPELIRGGGFEDVKDGKATGWGELWTREPDRGEALLDRDCVHSGRFAARITHRGARDWSFDTERRLSVRPGDLLYLKAWVRVKGEGSTTVCVVAYDKAGKVRDWVAGARTASGPTPWRRLTSRVYIPDGVTEIRPRLIGSGPATVWVDDVSLTHRGNILEKIRKADLPDSLSVENEALSVRLTTSDATLKVTDKRTGGTWFQSPGKQEGALTRAAVHGKEIDATWVHFPSGLEVGLQLELDRERPEVLLTLSARGELPGALRFPHAFVSESSSYLVIPMNEGISYPVDDGDVRPRRLIAYGGHGICMGFWGVTDGSQGHLAIIETPDDAAINIRRVAGRLCVAPEWDSQRGEFGYARKLRYVFLERGGHVAMCKRYRAHVKARGLLKTLEEKRLKNPNVDLLVGAVNVWCWERGALDLVREMRSLGMRRILWSHRESPRTIAALNDLGGVLTSRYDIYQDLMDPEVAEQQLRALHPDWTQRGWPDDLMVDAQGIWRKGWRVRGKDGEMYPCGVLCDRKAPEHARRRVPKELETHPYRCRFIDTTTASSWRECYHPDHPMSRSESRKWKMELLRCMSQEWNLVTGSETGHEAAVPYVHYFEGMLSLGPYRIPDAGRRMMVPVLEVPDRVAKFQVGEKYRLPLWGLVYHDCVAAHWYWGDYNNKLPPLWDKRDLFNILYATAPMFMFNREIWEKNKERFVRSYESICPVARAVGYAEMTDHRFLTPDRSVQQTVFANGVRITVNFGASPWRLTDGTVVSSGGHHVEGAGR